MTMKKDFFIFFVGFVLCSCFSCKKYEDSAIITNSSEALAVEIISRCQTEISNDFINRLDYGDFISPEVEQAMVKSRVYASRGVGTRSVDDSEIDTFYYSEQIPVCEDLYQQTKIYSDGQTEVSCENNIDIEGNPMLTFYDSPIDLDQFIAKMEIKDGHKKCYNKSGVLILSEPAELPDMKEYVEQLQYYVEQAQQETKSRSGSKRDIEWLRSKMQVQPQTRSGEPVYYKIEQLANGNVLLEQEMLDIGYSSSLPLARSNSSGKLITRTELSPDISRTMKYELLEDGKLVERRKYMYSDFNPKTRSMYLPMSDGTDLNPEQIITEKLVIMHDGTPMVQVRTENFQQNQVIFHFNKK